jgi:methylenetetrahydrofolate reductase (NADPH)
MWRVDAELAAMRSACDGFVVPDNHLGRATISSIAVASRAASIGRRAIACLNARDRNMLGLRRDLLTAAGFGVREFLFVYGDDPAVGGRTPDMTARKMLDEARAFVSDARFDDLGPFRFGAAASTGSRLGWRSEADFLFVQLTHDFTSLVRWREHLRYDGGVYPAVIVLTGRSMAERLMARISGLEVAPRVLDLVEASPDAAVDLACEQVETIRRTEAFAGVHLIPVNRHDAVAQRLRASRAAPVA